MCGITGFLNARADATRDELHELVQRMGDAMPHRGPDDVGYHVDEAAGLALGFRRLAILDLSPEGHQPMRSRSRRYTIVFNGEIYNYLELAKELSANAGGPIFRGHSDTEMILEAFEQWGVEPALKRFHGMFAFALWDTETKTLTLGRDRMGEKPLYYGRQGDVFLWGSELKVLRAHPAFQGAIDQAALAPFLAYSYVPAPRSIYTGISKLIPGTILQVRWEGDRPRERIVPYWSLAAVRDAAETLPNRGSDDDCRQELDRILRTVIEQQMLSDVPLGAFLSGGVDSSTVVAIMQALSPRPVKTFTIAFDEAAFSEAHHARAVADHLGVDHTELMVTGADALATIPTLPHVYDEPFADSSQIPTMLVSKLARTQVTVSLSGDGGDELFAGYERYLRAANRWQTLGRVPSLARAGFGRAFGLLSEAGSPTLAKASRLGEFLGAAGDPDLFYQAFVTTDGQAARALSPEVRAQSSIEPRSSGSVSPEVIRRFMHLDMLGYLPDDILVKVDRASMAFSLESRAPFLDSRVVEFAARLPMSMLVREGQGKWLLRQVLYQYVPKALIDRPKMGFGVPLSSWLRGPLRQWGDELLDERKLRAQGLLDPVFVQQIWREHQSGKVNRQYQLWTILMLQAWLEASAAGSTVRPELVTAA